MPANPKRTFLIRVRTTGDKALKDTVRSLKRVERSTKAIKNSLRGLRTLFLATFAGAGVVQIAKAADSIQLLSDRINIFTGDTVEGARALNLLFDAANLTNTSIDSLAETFNRVALATQELGLSTDELIGFTATLQNTFRLSGASIAESSAAAIQLSQGLASGQLRGQELRSVLEQNAVIGQILSDTLDTTRGNLIKFAESGKITSEIVLRALADNAQDLNEKAQGLGQTFGQTLIKAFNEGKRSINELNQRFKLNEKFQVAVEDLTKGFKLLAQEIFRTGGLLDTVSPFFNRFFEGVNRIRKSLKIFPTELESVKNRISDINSEVARLEKVNKIFENRGRLGKDFAEFFGTEKKAKRLYEERKKRIKDLKDELTGLRIIGKRLRDGWKETGETINDANTTIDAFAKGNYSVIIKQQALSLEQLNSEFDRGIIGFREYRDGLNEIERISLKKQFDEGRISLQEYREGLIKVGEEADTTFGKLKNGFELGSRSFILNATNLTLQFSKLTEQTFSGLEDAIFDFTKGTSDAFAKLTQQILDDLLRIAIRSQIIAPLAGSFAGVFEGGASTFTNRGVTGDFNVSANQRNTARQGKVLPFQQGGIVTRPTYFPMSQGTGLMAEAGAPEAVVPLTRTSSGDLGVQAIPNNVTVNVNNNAGVDVDVQSSQNGNNQVVDVTITRAVNKAISEGRFDRSLSSNFGLNRKGTR